MDNDVKKPEFVENEIQQETPVKDEPKSVNEVEETKESNPETVSIQEPVQPKEKYPQAPIIFKSFKTTDGAILKDGLQSAINKKAIPNSFILPSFNLTDQTEIALRYAEKADAEIEDSDLELVAGMCNSELVSARRAKGRNEIFRDRLDNSYFTNSVNIDNKEVNLGTLTADTIMKAKTNKEELAFYRFLSTIGSGEQINIPLWHSGFRLVLKPMDIITYASLMNTIQQDKASFGKTLIGFIYSYDSFIINRHVLNMVSNLIVYTTLNINRKEEDIFQHISILDLNMIYLGLLASLFSSGIEFSMQCKNAKEVNEDGSVKCTNQLVGLLDPTRIAWVDTDRLTTEDTKWMMKQMQKTSAASVSQEQAKMYKERIDSYCNIDSYSISSNNPRLKLQHTSKFMFKIPNLLEYLDTGEIWKTVIEEEVRKSLGDTAGTQPTEDEAVQNIYSILTSARYLAFIDRIENKTEAEENDSENTSSTLYDRELILKAIVSILSIPTKENKQKFQQLEESISKNIEDASVAIMAIPTFKCSKCGATAEEQQVFKSNRLKDLIPLDGIYTFFDVADLLSQNLE